VPPVPSRVARRRQSSRHFPRRAGGNLFFFSFGQARNRSVTPEAPESRCSSSPRSTSCSRNITIIRITTRTPTHHVTYLYSSSYK
jgi:hypothetical protein